MAAGSAPAQTLAHHLPTQVEVPKKDYFDVAAGFMKEKPFDFFKTVQVLCDILREWCWVPEEHVDTVGKVRHYANLLKLSKAPGSLLENTNKLRHEVTDWMEQPPTGKKRTTLWKVFLAANACISPIWDAVDFLTKAIIFISKKSVEPLRGVNGISLAISKCDEGFKQMRIFAAAGSLKDEDKFKARLPVLSKVFVKLVKSVAYIGLGVLTALSVFYGFVFSSATYIVLSATTVVCTIVGYIQDNLGKPLEGWQNKNSMPALGA